MPRNYPDYNITLYTIKEFAIPLETLVMHLYQQYFHFTPMSKFKIYLFLSVAWTACNDAMQEIISDFFGGGHGPSMYTLSIRAYNTPILIH